MTPEQYANYLLKIYSKNDAVRVVNSIIDNTNRFYFRSLEYYRQTLEIISKS